MRRGSGIRCNKDNDQKKKNTCAATDEPLYRNVNKFCAEDAVCRKMYTDDVEPLVKENAHSEWVMSTTKSVEKKMNTCAATGEPGYSDINNDGTGTGASCDSAVELCLDV